MSSESPKDRRRWGLPALIAGVAIVGGVVGGVIAYAFDSDSGSSASSSRGTETACAVTNVANDVLPSVVTINVVGTSSGQVTGGTGSGEVIRSDGYILTNNHVIAAAANVGTITVTFSDGKTASATLVGRDPLVDLAVIKVDQSSLPTISMGNSDSVKVGNPVVVLGAPLGLSSTVTNGIVSALDRTIEVPGESASQSALLVDAIQTDAAINPGNSGGAMTNCSGQLIGIPSAGATVPTEGGGSSAGSIGLGFAIPVNLAKTVSDELISTGTATHSFFGLSAQPVTDNGTLTGQVKGLLVSAVVPGGPSADAGLRAGDLITSIDGKPATDTTQLEAITLSKRPGDTVNLEYERNGEKSTATVTLGQLPTSST